jgi:hypothetical protein
MLFGPKTIIFHHSRSYLTHPILLIFTKSFLFGLLFGPTPPKPRTLLTRAPPFSPVYSYAVCINHPPRGSRQYHKDLFPRGSLGFFSQDLSPNFRLGSIHRQKLRKSQRFDRFIVVEAVELCETNEMSTWPKARRYQIPQTPMVHISGF